MTEANPYCSPEKFDLTMVGDAYLSEPDYDFNMCAVWRTMDGRLAWAFDSGCSCPYPFEDITAADLTYGTWMELKTALDDRISDDYGRNSVADLMGKVVA